MLIKPRDKKDITKAQSRHGGSSMIETRRFGSGGFYHFACINIDQLTKNMAKAYPDLPEDKLAQLVASLCGYYMMAMVGENPTGFQTGLNSSGTAEALAIQLGTDFPTSASVAFETPVAAGENGGFLANSKTALLECLQQKTGVTGGLGTDLQHRRS